VKVSRERALAYLRDMTRIRRFEEKCAEVYSAGKIRGFLHLYIGEEAVACGVMPELSPEDAVLATYREHGHALVRGLSARSIMAEMYGKQEGCCRGHGGSMHLFDASIRFFGGNAIVAGALPMAVGFGLADRMRRTKRISACFFGEGAVAEGEFHESANLASLWKLPVLFLCENNLYAMGTALDRSEADTDLCEKARSYRMTAAGVDGMDVLAVAEAARVAVDYVRAGNGPYFLELKTYRFRAHSMFDPDLYRSKAEVEAWKHRCPIDAFKKRLREAGLAEDTDIAAIEADTAREIQDALNFAEAGTLEPVQSLTHDVYTRERRVAKAGPPT
jgi:pyruvate dehydrogenase E1 component alpha subunit